MQMIYEGKAKKVYQAEDTEQCVIRYKDSATAFNGLKKAEILGKGEANCRMTAIFFELLETRGVPTHFIRQLDPTSLLVKKVDIVPLEVIIRNFSAGSFSKRYGLEEGIKLHSTVLEFCYKRDDLGDPMINRSQILALQLAPPEVLDRISQLAYQVNQELLAFLTPKGLQLVDFKLEFGLAQGEVLLADEISPDTCRFWDIETGKKLDKDLFRHGLGDLIPAYHEVLKRIGG